MSNRSQTHCLDLFVLRTSEPNRSLTKTMDSVRDLFRFCVLVENISEINRITKEENWWLVLYDNEYVNEDLVGAINSILEMDLSFDALMLIKKNSEDRYFQCPRLFKKNIELRENSLLPVGESSKMERILDGWILEHGF